MLSSVSKEKGSDYINANYIAVRGAIGREHRSSSRTLPYYYPSYFCRDTVLVRNT